MYTVCKVYDGATQGRRSLWDRGDFTKKLQLLGDFVSRPATRVLLLDPVGGLRPPNFIPQIRYRGSVPGPRWGLQTPSLVLCPPIILWDRRPWGYHILIAYLYIDLLFVSCLSRTIWYLGLIYFPSLFAPHKEYILFLFFIYWLIKWFGNVWLSHYLKKNKFIWIHIWNLSILFE